LEGRRRGGALWDELAAVPVVLFTGVVVLLLLLPAAAAAPFAAEAAVAASSSVALSGSVSALTGSFGVHSVGLYPIASTM